jgi:hypothetical protein
MWYGPSNSLAGRVLRFQLNSAYTGVWVSNCQDTSHEPAFDINNLATGECQHFRKHKLDHAPSGRSMVHPDARLCDVAYSWPVPMPAVRPAQRRGLGPVQPATVKSKIESAGQLQKSGLVGSRNHAIGRRVPDRLTRGIGGQGQTGSRRLEISVIQRVVGIHSNREPEAFAQDERPAHREIEIQLPRSANYVSAQTANPDR